MKNLADKPCYPVTFNNTEISCEGLTFRERLIVALASNPMMIYNTYEDKNNSIIIINQADAIIKQLEAEK